MSVSRQRKSSSNAAPKAAESARRRAGGNGAIGLKSAPAAIRGDFGIAQAKVTIGQPNDRYEQEADRAAEHVMRGERAPSATRIPVGGLKAQREPDEEAQTLAVQREGEEEAQTLAVQREGDEEAQTLAVQREGDEEAQTLAVQREGDEEAQTLAVQREGDEEAQTLAVQREGDEEAQTLAVQRKVDLEADERRRMQTEAAQAIRTRGPGDPLAPDVRAPLEQGLGADLGEVRVHEGGSAASQAKAMKAHAFTHKNHVWFGPGQSQRNLRLMAHETTHVLQQGAVVRRKPNTENVDPGELAGAGGDKSAAGGGNAGPTGGGGLPEPAKAGGAADGAMGAAPAGTTGAGGGAAPAAASGAVGMPGVGKEAGQGEGAGKAGAGAGAGKAEGKPGKGEAAPAGKEAPGDAGGAAGGELDVRRPDTPDSDADAENRLKQVMDNVETTQTEQKGPAADPASQSAAAEGATGEAAAATPVADGETEQAGQVGKIDGMDQQEAGDVDKTSFKDLVKRKLQELDTPASPEAMENFGEGGGAAELRAGVVGDVHAQAEGAQTAIRGATEAAPEAPPAREVAPLPEPAAPPEQRDMQAAEVLPPPKSEAETSLEPEREAVDARMEKENLSDERLAKANDPRFSGLGESKKDVHKNADTAPGRFQAQEQAVLAENKAGVEAEEQKQGAAMVAANAMSKGRIGGNQQEAMSRDEAKRAEVAAAINKIYAKTETDVKAKLDWLSEEVDRQFDEGEKKAREEFEDFVATGLRNWKIKRYGSRALIPVVGGLIAAGTWVYDKLKGISEFPEVKQIFEDGRQKYLTGLETMIDGIASTVDDTLAWCKTEIGKGKQAVQDYVAGLDDSLKEFAKQTTEEVFAKFDELGSEVDAKKEELADHLVQRYQESRDAIDARIEEMKAENGGLIDAFIGKLKEVLEALDNFRKKLLSLMSQASEVIELILEDPIGFLANLIKAVKLGFELFAKNIWEHLKQGLFGWLFGAFAAMGINIPKEFSIKSIVGFIMEVLGVTWDNIRPKIVRVVGERNVAILEKVVGYVKTLFTEGPKGLWEEIKEDLSSLKDTVMDAIKEWVITKIVTAAVTKIVSMFNPAGAIVQAVLAIYNVVMFFVERIDQILDLVQAIINSLSKIVKGDLSQAAAFVEKTMGLTLPIIIDFLARLIGLGGVAKKIKGVIAKVQKKVSKAVDKAIKKIVTRMKKLFGKGGDKKAGDANPEQNKQRALTEVRAALKTGIKRSKMKALLATLKKKYDLKQAELDSRDDVVITNSPKEKVLAEAVPPNPNSKDTTTQDLRVSETKSKASTSSKYDTRPKLDSGGRLLGTFTSQAPSVETVHGAVARHFSKFQYEEMPKTAPRPLSVKADLHGKLGSIRRDTSGNSQGMAGKFGEMEARIQGKTPDYDGGHLIANMFGGPEAYNNFVPMKRSMNQSGVYKKMEEWTFAQLKDLPPAQADALPIDLSMVVQPVYHNSVAVPVSEAAGRLGQHAEDREYATKDSDLQKLAAEVRTAQKALDAAKASGDATQITAKQAEFDAVKAREDAARAKVQSDAAAHKAPKKDKDKITFWARIPKLIKVSVTFSADNQDIANARSADFQTGVEGAASGRAGDTRQDAAGNRTTLAMGGAETSRGTPVARHSHGEVSTTKDPVLVVEGGASTAASGGGSHASAANSGPPGTGAAGTGAAATAGSTAPRVSGKSKFRKDFTMSE